MMITTNEKSCGTMKVEPNIESRSEDWRAELTPDVRLKVVNKIYDRLKNLKNQMPLSSDPDWLTRLTHIATQIEEKTFQNAATKDDYINTIGKKMDSYRHFATSNAPVVDQTFIVDDVGLSSDIVSVFSHDFSVEQKMQPNICPNIQREMPESQLSEQMVYQVQQQESRNQILKNKVQNTSNCSLLIQPNIHSHHHQQQQQQQHITSQATQLLYSQSSGVSTQLYQPPFGSNCRVIQQRQPLRQQHDVSQQRQQSMFHQNMPKAFQQPLGQQRDVSEVQLMQKLARPQLNSLNSQMHQHLTNMLQPRGVTSSEQKIQKIVQPVQLHGILDSQKQHGVSHEAMQQGLQLSAPLHQHQTIADQMTLFHLQRPFTGSSSASLESKAANIVDWHDEAYKKLQDMKWQYGSQLEYLQKQFMCLSEKAERPEQVTDCKKNLIKIDKMIRFLSMQQSQFQHMCKENFSQYQQAIIKYLSFFGKRNPAAVEQQAQPFQPPGSQSQMSQPHQNKNVKPQFHPVNLALTTNLGSTSSVSSMQPGVPNSQPNMFSSLQHSSGMGLEQRNVPSPLQHSARSVCQNILSKQQTYFSCNTIVNVSDSPLNHQTMLPPNLKQHMQSKVIQKQKQKMQMRNSQTGVTPGLEPPENQHQTLVPAIPGQPLATSQKSQHSSPQIGQQTLSSPLLKAGIPLQSSSSSSLIIASPSTPLTPSSIPLDPGTHNSCVSPLSRPEKSGQPKTSFTLNHVDIRTQICNRSSTSELNMLAGISASPLLMESTSPNGTQQASDTRQPVERLLKAVESISPKALSASAHEIGSIVNLVDMISGAAPDGDSRGSVGEDLVSKTRCHVQAKKFGSQHLSICSREMKHQISATFSDTLLSSLSTTDSVKQSKHLICDFDSTATSRVKRRRIEPNGDLLYEIQCINRRLFETVIDLGSNEDSEIITDTDEGTIVRCSYSAVAFSENFKPYASFVFPVLLLRLLVPANYPNSSPRILDELPVGWSYKSKESEYLSVKAKLRFSTSARNLSEPISLEEMAKTWDACARAVLSEYAQEFGGESFSSRYGTWENCLTA